MMDLYIVEKSVADGISSDYYCGNDLSMGDYTVHKEKIGYMRDTTVNPIFYDYKRKWQVYFELGVTLGAILLAVFGAGIIGIYSALFIPFGLASIFLVRGKLEKQTMPEYKHHIISYIHAIAILLAFVAVIIVAIILN